MCMVARMEPACVISTARWVTAAAAVTIALSHLSTNVACVTPSELLRRSAPDCGEPHISEGSPQRAASPSTNTATVDGGACIHESASCIVTTARLLLPAQPQRRPFTRVLSTSGSWTRLRAAQRCP